MIVSLVRCHNVLCSCPGAGEAGGTFLEARNGATRVRCVGLLVKACCAVSKAGWCGGRVTEFTTARPCALLGLYAEVRRRRLMVRPLANGTARINDAT